MAKGKLKQLIIISIILFIAVSTGAVVGTVTWVISQSPDISEYGQWTTAESTTIYTADGEVLTRLYEQDRVYAPLSEVPEDLENAIVAIEDDRFYDHYGIDVRGILRALSVNLRHRATVEGASTITQQLAKNALLTPERLYSRKLQEMYIALQFERKYTKDEILEFYLNEIFLGHSVYGVQNAANFYFNKDVDELTLAESALIAGLPRAPNYYSPYRNPDEAIRRRNVVLNRMLEQGYITAEEAEKASQEELNLEQGEEDDNNDNIAPYFVEHIRKELLDEFGARKVYTGGLEVHTSLDLEMQKQAEETVKQAIESGEIPTGEEGESQPQLSLITLDPHTGYIKSMIGGRNNDQFNRATQAYRQPGSAFKPFVYTEAVKDGAGTGTVVDDTPKEYRTDLDGRDSWIPRNVNDQYLGPTTLRTGLARSINVMTVRLLDEVGISNTMQTAREMGIRNIIPEDRNLSLALGGLTKGVSPLEMATAYGTLATGGIKAEPIAITKVLDNRGNEIYNNPPSKDIVLEQSEAYLVTDMLKSAVARGPDIWGTGWRAYLGRPAAGKTGTTSNYSDAWFVGYTPDLVTSVWLGEDSPKRMEYPQRDDEGNVITDDNGNPQTEIIASGHAAQLWGDYMRNVVQGRPVAEFERPNNIITKEINSKSGQLPGPYCPEHTITDELFIEGTEPTETCELHKETEEIEINTETGAIATEYCPEDEVETKEYQVETGIIVDEDGVPIRKVDPETQVPLTDDDGDYIYKTIPEEECSEHLPDDEEIEEDNTRNMRDQILDFFNTLR
ncbi:PBP1A family penicillin-binding protein [Natroniella sulfidigena]|uniref:transglycosylase domain-containing protein n=1 Tax=Natroniella sulfidigena TaxID=723921 RepID=UPI00200B68F0|nr:PBP1A family penicillin-binding protein [Natroniella sulfidigena]MCK8818100.1 PBP1A family penicillin-binding protein [Natroniella sulfidigena]